MKTYKVKSNLKHNKVDYKRGDKIELNETDAAPLLSAGVVVDTEVSEDDDAEVATPQPPVNEVKRENDDVEGRVSVEPGRVEKPQPGEETNDEEESTETDETEVTKSQYKVVSGVEFPRGTAHEAGTVLELTDEEAAGFAEGLIVKVDEENKDNL